MKALRRIFFALVLVVLLAAVLGVVAVRHYLAPEQLAPLLSKAALSQTQREWRFINPKLHLTHLTADRVDIAKGPSFGAGTEVEMEGVRLGWSVRQLVRGLLDRDWKRGPWDGGLYAQHLVHVVYELRGLDIRWQLAELSSGATLRGWVTIAHGPAVFRQPRSSNSGVLAWLVAMEQQGFLRLGIPSLERLPIDSLQGQGDFYDGLLHVPTLALKGPTLDAQALGVMTLASRDLRFDVNVQTHSKTGGDAKASLRVSGPLQSPRVTVSSFSQKAFKASIEGLLRNPQAAREARDVLRQLFR